MDDAPRAPCIDSERARALRGGALPSEEGEQIRRHAEGCAGCRTLILREEQTRPSRVAPPGVGAVPEEAERQTQELHPLPRAAHTDLEPGTLVRKFVVARLIGKGGMGAVYLARDPDLGRKVALKLIHADAPDDAQAHKTRLLREAQAMARLSHPNVVSVYEAGTWEDGVFLAMEFVEGTTLREWLRVRRSWQAVVAVMIQVGRGLAAAHAAGLVHRDLKPENILIGHDGAKVTDFGLARADQSWEQASPRQRRSNPRLLSLRLTQAGSVMGTPAYMAPEQYVDAAPDDRVDQFSFCVTLFEALHGQLPWEPEYVIALADELQDASADAATRRVSSPASKTPSGKVALLPAPRSGRRVPRALRRVLARGLSPRPIDRYPSIAVLLRDLQALLSGSRRRVWAAAALSVAVMAAAVGAVFAWTAPAAPRQLVVADFENRTGEAAFDNLAGLLTTVLQDSQRLQVTSREELFDQARGIRDPKNRGAIGVPLADQIAQRVGADLVVAPIVERVGDRYHLEAAVRRAGSERTLFTVNSAAAGGEELSAAVERLAHQLRDKLDDDATKPAQSSPRSVLAHQHYDRGLAAETAGNWGPALIEFRAATATDPRFAMAHYRTATTLLWTRGEGAQQALDQAAAFAGALPLRDQLMIRALRKQLAGDDAGALADWRGVLASDPDDEDAHWWLGDRLFHLLRTAEAVPHFEAVLALDPAHSAASDHLIRARWILGQDARALEEIQRRRASMSSVLYEARSWALRGDWARAEALLREQLDSPEWRVRWILADVRAIQGDYADAASLMQSEPHAVARFMFAQGSTGDALKSVALQERAARAARDSRLLARLHLEKAAMMMTSGQAPARGADALLAAVDLAPRDDLDHAQVAAWLEGFAVTHRFLDAPVGARDHVLRIDPGRTDLRLISGETEACARAPSQRSMDALTTAVATSDGATMLWGALALSRCAIAAGRPDVGLDATDRFLRAAPEFASSWSGLRWLALPELMALRGRAQVALGDRAAAEATMEELVRLWPASPETAALRAALKEAGR